MTALAPTRLHGSGPFTQLAVLTSRSLRTMVTDWQVTVFGLVQPIFMLLVISQVFGSMADPSLFPPGVDYIDFLIPGILITTGIGPAIGAGVGLIKDMENGIMARFRSLPVQLYWVMFGRSVSELVRATAQIGVMLVGAVAFIGFAPPGGAVGALGTLGIAIAVTWSMTWLFLAFGACTRSPQAMQTLGFLAVFPLTFASSAFVPVAVLPGWLQAVAAVNPLTPAVEAARRLTLGQPVGGTVAAAVLASLAVGLGAMVVATLGIRRRVAAN